MKRSVSKGVLTRVSNFTKIALIVATATITIASCVKDLVTESAFLPESDVDLNRTVYVSVGTLDVADMEKGNEDAAKALARATEDQTKYENAEIYDLWVIQIDPSTEGEAVVAARFIENFDNEEENVIRLYPYENGKTCDIIYVANTADDQIFSRGMTRKEVYSATYDVASEQALFASEYTNSDNGNVFILSQLIAGIEIKIDDDKHNSEVMAATLLRNVAKVEFSVSYNTSGSGLVWKTASICNLPTVASYTARISSSGDSNTYFDEFPVDLDHSDLTSYSDSFADGSGDGSVNMFYFYLPVNMRGIESAESQKELIKDTAYSDFANNTSYKYYDWSLKSAAAKASGNEGIGLATYFKLVGTLDDAVHDSQGLLYDVVFQEYIGADAVSYNILPNCLYTFTINTGDVDSYTLLQDARFSLSEAADSPQMFDINILQSNKSVAAYSSYTPDVSISKAGTTTTEEYAKEDTDIYTLAAFYIASDGEILGKILIDDYTQYDGSSTKAQIDLVPGSHTAGGYMLYIANVNNPSAIFAGITARSYNGDLELAGYGDNVSTIYNMTTSAVASATESTLFSNTSGDVNRVIMSGTSNDSPITRSTTLTQPVFYRNVARMSYTISNTNTLSELIWSSIQVHNVPRVYGYATYHGNSRGDWTTFPLSPSVDSYSSYTFTDNELTAINYGAGLTLYYYLPVNKRSEASLSTTTWGDKYTAAIENEAYKDNATYVTIKGHYLNQIGDENNEQNFELTYTNYLGATSSDLNIFANCNYAYTLRTSADTIDDLDLDPRFDLEPVVETEREYEIATTNHIIAGRKKYTIDVDGTTTTSINDDITEVSTTDGVYISSLHTYYIDASDNIIGLSTDPSKITLTPGVGRGGYLLFVANATTTVAIGSSYETLSENVLSSSATSNGAYIRNNGLDVMTATHVTNITTATNLTNIQLTFTRNNAKVIYNIDNVDASGATELVWSSIGIKNAPTTSYSLASLLVDSSTETFPANNNRIALDDTDISDSDMSSINAKNYSTEFYIPVNIQPSVAYSTWAAKYVGTIADINKSAVATYIEPVGYYIDYKNLGMGEQILYELAFNNFLGSSASDFSLEPNAEYEYTLSTTVTSSGSSGGGVTGDNTSGFSFADDERFIVDQGVTDHRISNCYILNLNSHGSGSITFNVVDRINEYWGNSYEGYGDNAANVITDDNWTCDILWNDVAPNLDKKLSVVKVDSESVRFRAASLGDLRGNAVVVVYKDSSKSTILWSWHIWITDYNPDSIAAANPNPGTGNISVSNSTGSLHCYNNDMFNTGVLAGKYIMDRNLGARTTGYEQTTSIYYQFGRKDPLPSSDATVYHGTSGTLLSFDNAVVGGVTIENSIQNPTIFYTSDGSWCSDAKGTTYQWQDTQVELGSSKKSIFDPSPAGWMVPQNAVWENASGGISNYIVTLFDNAIFMANGTRGYGTGTMYAVGTYAYIWTSTPHSATIAYTLSIYTTSLLPLNCVGRAGGRAIRAVQE
ncbi:MAG: hypothetical protein SNH79_01035 [Rikenellaceae bacterium]